MSAPEDEGLDFDKFSKRVNLSLAHSELTRWGASPRSEADKDKILKSLFLDRSEYEQYVIDLQDQEERERKESEARETARLDRLENDPKHWKRMYEGVVEREKRKHDQQRTNRQMWFGAAIVLGAFVAISFLLKLFGID